MGRKLYSRTGILKVAKASFSLTNLIPMVWTLWQDKYDTNAHREGQACGRSGHLPEMHTQSARCLSRPSPCAARPSHPAVSGRGHYGLQAPACANDPVSACQVPGCRLGLPCASLSRGFPLLQWVGTGLARAHRQVLRRPEVRPAPPPWRLSPGWGEPSPAGLPRPSSPS